MTTDPALRLPAAELTGFAGVLFRAAGLAPALADAVAASLVEADRIGHETHGLALVPKYLEALRTGDMAAAGAHEVIRDTGPCLTWEGGRLPGAWLAGQAMDLAVARAARYGTCTVAIAGSYHMGALAVYLERATQAGMMAMIASSTPSTAGVAPFGGTASVMTPNPLAAGIPGSGDPVLLDISASITTKNKAIQYAEAGRRLPGQWLQDAEGRPSDDPAVAISGGGTLLPVGGADHGHKGYALGLLVEALTQGLSGTGRVHRPTGTFTSIFLQVLDPACFAGALAFRAIIDHLAQSCRESPPRPGGPTVRVPGDRAAQCRRASDAAGVPLSPEIVAALAAAAGPLGVALPAGLAQPATA
ncbi:Ldh family oxidoreductase [Poseidonocella sp. HB161398]|uniref:Ldh family oxidoreductase n=1 Tax=Poseidonocella sp. HB161398 TaxID=2320855 RepID=UPI001107E77C|nr:Ldh family oxidoreductase [Poseidonocella sp. HB161398]